MKQFKVFYSWQSDLPGNKTKWFINECIEEAVEKCNMVVEGTEILADRDTKGKTGSPNITQTIFEKIDDCDLFVADVSIVNSYGITAEEYTEDDALDFDGGTAVGRPKDCLKPQFRYSPNPNVLIELGYAVKCLGWEKVLCFLNTDFGKIEQLPFDLDHQRVTPYLLEDASIEESKKDNRERVKKELRGIIVDTILELAKQGGNPKKGKAYHVVGTFDPESKMIDDDLVAYDVTTYCWIDDYYEKHKADALKLIREIKEYNIPMRENKKYLENDGIDNPFVQMKKLQNAFGFNSEDNMIDCVIDDIKQDSIKKLSAKYLDEGNDTFDEVFFNLGNLLIQAMTPVNPILGRMEPRKTGTDYEKEKFQKINDLNSTLIEMQQLELYLKTFDDLLLFPLAIANNSQEIDTEIEVDIEVEGCEVVSPSVDLIHHEIREAASIIYQTGFPMNLLFLQDDTDIKYDDDSNLYYNPNEPFYGNSLPGLPASITDEDYGYAMRRYVAIPITENAYRFNIRSLRANEKKWLGGIIAVRKPTEDTEIKMQYKIISNNTSGDIDGELIYRGMIR